MRSFRSSVLLWWRDVLIAFIIGARAVRDTLAHPGELSPP